MGVHVVPLHCYHHGGCTSNKNYNVFVSYFLQRYRKKEKAIVVRLSRLDRKWSENGSSRRS
eukprot:11815622-Prorocentrum_lima.AAC.1